MEDDQFLNDKVLPLLLSRDATKRDGGPSRRASGRAQSRWLPIDV